MRSRRARLPASAWARPTLGARGSLAACWRTPIAIWSESQWPSHTRAAKRGIFCSPSCSRRSSGASPTWARPSAGRGCAAQFEDGPASRRARRCARGAARPAGPTSSRPLGDGDEPVVQALALLERAARHAGALAADAGRARVGGARGRGDPLRAAPQPHRVPETPQHAPARAAPGVGPGREGGGPAPAGFRPGHPARRADLQPSPPADLGDRVA